MCTYRPVHKGIKSQLSETDITTSYSAAIHKLLIYTSNLPANLCKYAARDTDHDKLAEFKDLSEFTAHRVLEMLRLSLSHLTAGEVKHLLTTMTLCTQFSNRTEQR